MSNCQECHRPIAPQWRVCGWCGTEQAPRGPQAKLFVRVANLVLFLQAMALTGGTIALAVVWAMRGWSIERGQTLGIIWLGVMMSLGLTAWLSVNLSSQGGPERNAPRAY